MAPHGRRTNGKGAALVAALFAAEAFALPGKGQATPLTASELSFLHEVNAARTARGLGTVRVDERLEQAARAHSDEMVARGWFGHGRWWQRLVDFGARGPTLGEDLGWTVQLPHPAERIVQ